MTVNSTNQNALRCGQRPQIAPADSVVNGQSAAGVENAVSVQNVAAEVDLVGNVAQVDLLAGADPADPIVWLNLIRMEMVSSTKQSEPPLEQPCGPTWLPILGPWPESTLMVMVKSVMLNGPSRRKY